MPIFEFICLECGAEYEELTKYDPQGEYEGVLCPHCSSQNKEHVMSLTSFSFTNPQGTDRWNNSHDYRFKSKQPALAQQRKIAERTSHMGSKPYNNIDDVSSGKYFGEVK